VSVANRAGIKIAGAILRSGYIAAKNTVDRILPLLISKKNTIFIFNFI
jgi:hypothetical protein